MFEPTSSTDGLPIFVASGRGRKHAVRLAATTVGVLLAAWLAALAAGLIGFAPLPQLTLPAADHGDAIPTVRSPRIGESLVARASAKRAGGLQSKVRREAKRGHAGSRPPSTAGRAPGTTGGGGTAGSNAGTSSAAAPAPTGPAGAATNPTPSPVPTSPGGQPSTTSDDPAATTSPDGPSGSTSPDGSAPTTSPSTSSASTSPSTSGATTSPDAPVDQSVPTG
jgi:hypothetical protein